MKNIIRWGIVGPGQIAHLFAESIKNVEGAELMAVASTSEERGKAFAGQYNIPNVFVGYDEMAKSALIDAVYIATPHPFHKPCAEIFLNAKKHVLCEKPICVNAAQAIALKECAEKNGVFLMEALWTRFLPAIGEALKIAKSGVIGDIRGVSADFSFSSLESREESRLFRNELGGGALLDAGIYGLNFAAIFLGNDPKSIFSISDINGGVDCQTNILLKYNSGALASVSAGITVDKPEFGYIYGTKGYITLPQFHGAQEIFVKVNNEEKHISKPRIGYGFEEEIYEACSCIREGKLQSDIMPMSESIKIMKQMDCIREQIGLKYPCDV